MSAESWAALVTGVVAGLAALLGFLGNQLANRRERKSKIYAEALEAVQQYTELPFIIRRRPSSDGATRAALGDKISEVQAKLWFYRTWIQIDSAEVGDAYNDLVDQTKRSGGRYWALAWTEPVMTRDEEAHLQNAYKFDNRPEVALCLLVMRRELSLWTPFLRRSTRRLLALQRERRASERAVSQNIQTGESPSTTDPVEAEARSADSG